MFKLVISPRAQIQLKKLKKADELPVKIALEDIKEDPFLGKPLGRGLTGRFSYRFEIYRIIYRVNDQDKIVRILSAGHRSTVYN